LDDARQEVYESKIRKRDRNIGRTRDRSTERKRDMDRNSD
jgi:hypothetical protein